MLEKTATEYVLKHFYGGMDTVKLCTKWIASNRKHGYFLVMLTDAYTKTFIYEVKVPFETLRAISATCYKETGYSCEVQGTEVSLSQTPLREMDSHIC